MLVFGSYEIDEPRRLLHRGGARVALEPRVFDLLLYLIRNRERAVSRVEILKHVWAGVAVEQSVLSTALRKLRKALEDEPGVCPWVETVHGFGLRFQGEVRASTRDPEIAPPPPLETGSEPAADDPPVIAVRAPCRIAEATRDLTLLTCEALLVQLQVSRVLRALDAELVADEAGRLLGSMGGVKVHYALTAHASETRDGFETVARLTDLATLRVIWSQRVVVQGADPSLAARELAARIATSVSRRFVPGRQDLPTETAPDVRTH